MTKKKQPAEQCWSIFLPSTQLKSLLSLCIQDAVQKRELRDYIRLQKMAVPYLDQKSCEKHFSIWNACLCRCCSHGQVQASREKKLWRLLAMDNTRAALARTQRKRERGRYRPALATNFLGNKDPKRKKVLLERRTSRPAAPTKEKIVQKEMNACDNWQPLECTFYQTGEMQNRDQMCV